MPKSSTSQPKIQTSTWLWIMCIVPALLTLLVAALILTKTVGVDMIGYLVLPVGASAFLVAIPYSRTMDEHTIEGHKAASTWGMGAACAIVGIIGFEMAAFPGVHGPVQDLVEGWIAFSKGVFGDQPGAVGFYFGVIASMFVLALGYTVAWLVWWARQRIGTKAD